MDTAKEVTVIEDGKELPYKMKDEMNFADAGGLIFAGTPANVKTVSHEEKEVDFSQGKRTTKKITITASDNCRLPLPSDAKVFVALISLTAPHDFAKQEVRFTLLDLLKILGWVPDGRNYERLKSALTRLRSVRFIFENTWYSNGDKTYTSEDFNILDSLKIVDSEKRGRRTSDKDKCYFKWSDTLYRSFKENNVKDIDLHYLQTLSDLAFSIYRYLDKAFYWKSTLEYDLQSFAERMGIKRTKANNLTKIRGRLQRAFQELEKTGYLVPMSLSERFQKRRRGEWNVLLVRNSGKAITQNDSEELKRLLEHGVKRKQAERILRAHEQNYVIKVLEYFEEVVLAKEGSRIRTKGGWLNSAFNNPEFCFPRDFESSIEKRERLELEAAKKLEARKREQASLATEVKESQLQTLKYKTYWDQLSDSEKEKLEQRAVEAGSKAHQEAYERGRGDKGAPWKSIRQYLIQQQIDKELSDPFSL